MFDNRYDWLTIESKHFIYKYFPKSFAEKNIEDIIEKRELAYQSISNCLGVQSSCKLKMYILPDRETAQLMKIPANASFPDRFTASIIYSSYPFCSEKISYGHEITHLLVYFWDKEKYHLQFLEEGLATYLDQSGMDKHLEFIQKLKQQIYNNKFCDLSLNIYPIANLIDYEKAASFVKYLIEFYGILKFKQLYLASKINRLDNIYYVNGKKLNPNYLKSLIRKIYKKNVSVIQREWLSNLGIIL